MKKQIIIFAASAMFLMACGGAEQKNQCEKSTESQCAKIPESQRVLENGGSGDFKAVMFEDSTFNAHTIFCPKDLSKFSKENPLPILVWGNGACNNSPHEHVNFLNEIASHGYLVVATGFMPSDTGFYKGPMSKSSQQIESIDWAVKQNSDKNSYLYNKLDTNNIAAAGMSCGGLQTLFNCADSRLKTIMICNSGLFINPVEAIPDMPMPPKSKLEDIHTPVIYILGGKQDIAYENGMDDFHKIKHVPAFAANFPVGHGGTYSQPFGGEFSVVALSWLDWQLKNNQEAAKMFKGENPLLGQRKDWTIEKNDLIDK
ncbi:MAG: alpha/beta hydrolase [Bacteroidales bacterium]|nr:alpha/beta hydrolase [Bacteroidales bacterium]